MNPVRRNAFTLVEVLIVIMILGILAAVAVPRFASAGDDARTSATQSVLAGVRAAIASHRTAARAGRRPVTAWWFVAASVTD